MKGKRNYCLIRGIFFTLFCFSSWHCGGGQENFIGAPILPATDTTAPEFVRVTVTGYLSLDVEFSEPLSQASTENIGNYSIRPDKVAGIAVSSAKQDSSNPSIVHLILTKPMLPMEYKLTVKNIADTSENLILENSQSSFVGNGKVAFLTAAIGNGKLASWKDSGGVGGLAAADNICQAEATQAGLKGDFKAWLSNSTADAKDRIGLNSGPWIRTDGFPLTATSEDLFKGELLVPLMYSANGEVPANLKDANGSFTNTNFKGERMTAHCDNWTSDSSDQGSTTGYNLGSGGEMWTSSSTTSTGCDISYRLYCFQMGQGPQVPDFKAEGKIVFMTSSTGRGDMKNWPNMPLNSPSGIAGADEICKKHAESVGLKSFEKFKALISGGSQNGFARLTSNGPWVLTNGVKIANNRTELTSGKLFTAINRTESGKVAFRANKVPIATNIGLFNVVANFVWTGMANDKGDSYSNGTFTCNGWLDSTSLQHGGMGAADIGASEGWLFFPIVVVKCDQPHLSLYCFEDE